jgi:phosphatidylinositol-3-phosphatase
MLNKKAALSAAATLTLATSAHAASVQTVFVIALENHNFTQPSTDTSTQQLFGNPAAPYLNSLITPGNPNAAMTSYASNYVNVPPQTAESPSGAGAVHPSEPNYIWSEAGQTAPNGVRTDGDPAAGNNNILPASVPSLSAELQTKFGAAGSWKSYQEDSQLDSNGTTKSTYTVPLASVRAPMDRPIPTTAATNSTSPQSTIPKYSSPPRTVQAIHRITLPCSSCRRT